MENIKFYKNKFIDYCEDKSIDITQEILEIFNEKNLENIYTKLSNLETGSKLDDYLEILCEELIINNISKIERIGMKLGLHRMHAILKLFDNPEKRLRVIHIAGTNGKGSVSAYLHNVLKQKYKVGMYSSPGMISFNDRIRINDEFISYKKMYETYVEVIRCWEENFGTEESLSFFEILTVVAILHFSRNDVDFVIMEVGLGGRYDATNVFTQKELSIITKIGLDHTSILGETLEEIAFEKSGIIQQDDVVISYPASSTVKNILKRVAEEKQANISFLDENSITDVRLSKKRTTFNLESYNDINLKMLGLHQTRNSALAIKSLENLFARGVIKLSSSEILLGVENTVWAGRLEWLTDNILIDGAHNIDGVSSLINYVAEQKIKKIKVLVGILADKDYKEMVGLLEKLDAKFYITNVPIEIKSSSVAKLQETFKRDIVSYENYKQALTEILKTLQKDETLIITGSLYLISAVRKYVLENIK